MNYRMFMITSRRIIDYGAKKFVDRIIFSGNGEKYCSVVVITIMFLCLAVELFKF